jgi:nucleotidyltransferase substrate binding protein (TIGR01987 family)
VLKEAFSAGILSEGELWLEMLEGRNRLAHTYNEETFLFALDKIKNHYYPEIIALQQRLSGELEAAALAC